MRTRRFSRTVVLGTALVAGFATAATAASISPKSAAKHPGTPAAKHKLVSIDVFPSKLELSSIRDSRRLIVTVTDDHGLHRDVTDEVKLTTTSPHIAIESDGFVVPKS